MTRDLIPGSEGSLRASPITKTGLFRRHQKMTACLDTNSNAWSAFVFTELCQVPMTRKAVQSWTVSKWLFCRVRQVSGRSFQDLASQEAVASASFWSCYSSFGEHSNRDALTMIEHCERNSVISMQSVPVERARCEKISISCARVRRLLFSQLVFRVQRSIAILSGMKEDWLIITGHRKTTEFCFSKCKRRSIQPPQRLYLTVAGRDAAVLYLDYHIDAILE